MAIYLEEKTAKKILECKDDEITVSLDLGRSEKKIKRRLLRGIPLEKVKGDFVYMWDGKGLFKVAIAAGNYYRLRMIKGFPVLEIDGLRMQLVRDFKDPLEYSRMVVNKLEVVKGDCVLDTCTGLGYTAIAAYKMWASVVTFEKDENVLEIAKTNPWSSELFEKKEITHSCADAFVEIKKLPDGGFDRIIHDPPRFSLAGELYSLEFHKELLRVAKKGGKLFHYVGSVGNKSGKRIEREVADRLRAAGWRNMKYHAKLQGVFADKG